MLHSVQPDREDEMARVEAAGGRVIFWNGYRVLGVLAMSRAIGEGRIRCTHAHHHMGLASGHLLSTDSTVCQMGLL